MDFVSRLEEKLKSLEGKKKSKKKKSRTPKKDRSTTKTKSNVDGVPLLLATQLSPMRDRTQELARITSASKQTYSNHVAVQPPQAVLAEQFVPAPSPTSRPTTTRSTLSKPISKPVLPTPTFTPTPTPIPQTETFQKKIPAPMSSSSLQRMENQRTQHIERTRKARERDTMETYSNENPMQQIPQSPAELRSNSIHMERQFKARQIRQRQQQMKIGSEPNIQVSTKMYQSVKFVQQQEAKAEALLLYQRQQDAETKQDALFSQPMGEQHALVVNHTTHEQRSYVLSPSPSRYYEEKNKTSTTNSDNNKVPNTNDNQNDTVQTVGKAFSAHDENVFAVVTRTAEEKQGNGEEMRTPSKFQHRNGMSRSSNNLRVSDLFDAHSPYHPRNNTKNSAKNAKNTTSMGTTSIASSASYRTRRNESNTVVMEQKEGWANIFNGSGTKQRARRKKQYEATAAHKEGVEQSTRARIVKQRKIMTHMSSQHIDAVVSKGVVKNAMRRGTGSGRKKITTQEFHTNSFNQNALNPLNGLMKKATRTEQNLKNVLLMLSKS